MKDLRGFLQVARNGHGPRDDVEQDVPLRAQQHEQHSRKLHTTAEAEEEQQNNGKKRGRRDRGGHLNKRLGHASETRAEANGHADRDSPECAQKKCGIDAQKSKRGSAEEFNVVFAMKVRKLADSVKDRETETNQDSGKQQVGHALAQSMLLGRSKGFGGAAGADREEKREAIDDGTKEAAVQPHEKCAR